MAYEFDLISFWVETTFLKDALWLLVLGVSLHIFIYIYIYTYLSIYYEQLVRWVIAAHLLMK